MLGKWAQARFPRLHVRWRTVRREKPPYPVIVVNQMTKGFKMIDTRTHIFATMFGLAMSLGLFTVVASGLAG